MPVNINSLRKGDRVLIEAEVEYDPLWSCTSLSVSVLGRSFDSFRVSEEYVKNVVRYAFQAGDHVMVMYGPCADWHGDVKYADERIVLIVCENGEHYTDEPSAFRRMSEAEVLAIKEKENEDNG